jgi:hypothetical protein
MTCLNETHIQALADGEGSAEARQHARECADCAARLQARSVLMASIAASIDPPVAMPASLARQVEESFRPKAEATRAQAGATRLRESPGFRLSPASRGFRLQAEGKWIYGLGVAAATLIAILFVAPAIRKGDATVSASEILAKSASQLSARVTGGVELLEYQLVLDGVPKEMMPDGADGTYRVQQAIDHDVAGRFRFASFGPDGHMLTSIAEQPGKGRVMAVNVEGQPYRFEVSLPAKSGGMSLPEMERLHMEASIAMMQAAGNQMVETIDGPHGKLYRIEMPRVSGPGTSPVWDLSEARVMIDARDYRITELSVRGSFLKQAYSLTYTLISHSVVGSVPADTWGVPAVPGQIVISGEGTNVPTHDVVLLSLRELTKLKQGR